MATRDDGARLRAEVAAVDVAGSQNVNDALRAMTAHDARLHDEIARLSGNAVLREALARTHVHLHVFRLHFERGIGLQALSDTARSCARLSVVGPTTPRRPCVDTSNVPWGAPSSR